MATTAVPQTAEKSYLTDWRNSEAKKQLKKLIDDGVVTRNTDPNDIYENMCEGIFKNYKKANFKTNLKNLLSKTEQAQQAVARDEVGFLNDLALVGRPTVSYRGGPVWHLSEASKLLAEDIRSGRHNGFVSVEAMRQSNVEYKKFGRVEFAEHVRQMKRKFSGRSYWMADKEKRKKKDEELRLAMEALNVNVIGQT